MDKLILLIKTHTRVKKKLKMMNLLINCIVDVDVIE